MLTYSFDQATFACPHFSTNQVEMITQETNPVYWACTHCLTLEPWTVIISTFILVQFDNTIRFATLESVRPGLTAKGSFKNSKSKGRNLFIHLCEIFYFIVKCVTGICKNVSPKLSLDSDIKLTSKSSSFDLITRKTQNTNASNTFPKHQICKISQKIM